jgi:hypothetical protein
MSGDFPEVGDLRWIPDAHIPAIKIQTATAQKREKRKRTGFLMTPVGLMMLLGRECHEAVILALFLLRRRFEQETIGRRPANTPITVSNIAVREWGLSHFDKTKALKQGEASAARADCHPRASRQA